MSANQMPHPARYATPGCALPGETEWDGKPREHSCPRCWMNGGVGHTPREVMTITRKLQQRRAA